MYLRNHHVRRIQTASGIPSSPIVLGISTSGNWLSFIHGWQRPGPKTQDIVRWWEPGFYIFGKTSQAVLHNVQVKAYMDPGDQQLRFVVIIDWGDFNGG